MSKEIRRITVVDDDNYQDFLKNQEIVLMMGREGGLSCGLFRSALETITGRFPEVSFGVVWLNRELDTIRFRQDYSNLLEWYDYPPTTIFIKDGTVESCSVGYLSAREIEERIITVFNPRRGLLR